MVTVCLKEKVQLTFAKKTPNGNIVPARATLLLGCLKMVVITHG